MPRADVNRAIDPDSLPPMSTDGRPLGVREQSDLDSLELLEPVPRGSIDEMREEPPWLAEFLAQYRLVFGSSNRIAPPISVHPDPIRCAEAQQALLRPLRDEIAASGLHEASPGRATSSDQPSQQLFRSFQGPLDGERDWTHALIGLAIAALLVSFIVMAFLMRLPHQVNEKNDVTSPPVIGLQVAKVEAAAPVTPIATNEQIASNESSDRLAGGEATPSAGSLNPVDSSASGPGQVPPSVRNKSVSQDSGPGASGESLGTPSSLPPPTVPKADESLGVPLRRVQPTYPSEALLRRLEGLVALQADISQDGKVRHVKVVSGDPILAKAAVVAVRQWIYPPSSSDERERRQQQITIHFKAP